MLQLLILLLPGLQPAPAPGLAPVLAVQEDLEAWITKGRQQIAAGDLAGARATLEQAAAVDGGGEQSSIWLMRLQVAEGDWDDVLSGASRMKRDGKNSMDLTYVTGLALAAKTQADLASAGFLIEDAKTALAEALEADPERYGDAWIELARVGLLTGDTEISLKAARAVIERTPEDAEAHLLAGRAELSLGAVLYNAEEPNRESVAHLERAKADLERSLELAGNDIFVATDAAMQLGGTAAFMGDDALKLRAYTLALGLAPDNNANVNTAWNTLGHEAFQQAAETALVEYGARVGDRTEADATLRWWYGWSLYTTANADPEVLAKAGEAFTEVLKKAPAFVNSHYYLGLIAYDSARYKAAAASWSEFRRYMGADAAATFANDELGPARLEFVTSKVFEAGELEAAIDMAELLTEIEPANPVFWNNLALFSRDFGDVRRVRLEDGDEDEQAAITALYEDAFRAYSKALDLEPENPAYLNDTALVLHYNLERDYVKAMAMYKAATAAAEALLASEELGDDERGIIEIALRDSKDNAAKLERKLKGEPSEGTR